KGEVLLLVDPDAPVVLGPQGGGRPAQLAGAVGVADSLVRLGHAVLGCVHVGLHLGQGDRALGQAAVAVHHRVVGVIPALVGQAAGAVALVLDEAVAVGVAV